MKSGILILLIALAFTTLNSCHYFGKSSEYYGMDVSTKRNVFVIDISGSMEGKVEVDMKGQVVAEATERAADKVGGTIGGKLGSMVSSRSKKELTKLAEVKRELMPVVRGLPEDSYFNIILFENQVKNWKKDLIPATKTNRNLGIVKIENLESGGGTNLYGGLEEAFKMAGAGVVDSTRLLKVESIFFLTDGEPSAGTVTNKDAILKKIKELNTLGRVKINVVGLGKDKDAEFLKKLAHQNGGTYIDK